MVYQTGPPSSVTLWPNSGSYMPIFALPLVGSGQHKHTDWSTAYGNDGVLGESIE